MQRIPARALLLLAMLTAVWTAGRVAFPAASSPVTAHEQFIKARQLLARGAVDSALAAVKAGLQEAPQSVEGLNLLGIILAHQGHGAQSLEAFQAALKVNPHSTETYNNLGDLYVSERKLNVAEKEFRAALRLDPGDRTANYNLGAILLSRRASEEAKKYLLRVHPEDAATRLDLVEAYLDTGETARASALAGSLSRGLPNNLRLHFSLGLLFASAHQYQAAIHELELADTLRPGTFEILRRLGEAYLNDGDYAKADTTLQRAVSLKPNSVAALYLQAQTYAHENELLRAFHALFRAHQLAPENTDVIYLLARLSMRLSYYEDAVPLLEAGVKIDPRRSDLHAALGECYYYVGRMQKAYGQFQILLHLDPSASSYVFMGLYYKHQGQFGAANQYFEKGLKENPHSADCLYNLGAIADKQGNYRAAEKLLGQALQADPNYGDALFELATVKMEEKKFAQAIPLLRHCVKINPNKPQAYYKLAVAERNLHQDQAAEIDFKVFETLAKNPSPMPMPFRHFLETVSQKASLPPEQQAETDLRQLSEQVQQHPDRPRNLYLLAQTYLKLGQASEALAALARLRQLSGGDTRTMTGAGVLLARYKLYPDAVEYFRQALGANPASDDAKYDLADAYFEMRDYAHALEWLQRISAQGKNDPAALALLGDTDAHLGRLPDAESIFEAVIRRSPDDDRYYLSLALTQLRAGDLAGARRTLSQGQARIPDSGMIFWGKGVLSVMGGNNQQAEADFQQALDLMPEWESSYSVLGTFYFETGQISKAGQILDRYSQIFPHGSLKVASLRRLLTDASREEPPEPVTLSPQARMQFLRMALVLADSNP